jgi:hypothetical protein
MDGAPNIQIEDCDARLIRQEGRRFCLAFDPQQISAHDLIARIARNYPVQDLFVENPPIEAIVAQMYAQRATSGPARNGRSWGRHTMKPYLAVLRSRFLSLLQYRAAALAGVGTQVFFGLVRIMIYDGFYRSSSAQQPLTADQVGTYIWLGQALLLLGMLDVDKDIAGMIRSGSVAYEMARPLDLYNLWLARAVSGRAAPLIMRAMPIFVVAGLFLELQRPATAGAAALFIISIVIGLMLAATMVVFMTISCCGRSPVKEYIVWRPR